ncbi:pyrroline-5-carboxylate reductase [Gloeocapsa sp. PCC 73106]|uniref:pyrroline-5-carboxylate reductase n=1 Tax=Gloeocapsa sp. PCC 73106 TaxID=102232 RepID=UPI0002AC129B|nr:pyrroline-5-carboxylate reductase [Gloeocapsa sp. PCC 73106]ELR99968.1 pyrroline-5-carboxylate reductase [Gloeocapsa sp. PCC 73106]
MSIKLGIIGGGVMAEAILSRLVNQRIYAGTEILVSDPQEQRGDYLAKKYQIEVTVNNQAVLQATEVLLLAIKPQVLSQVLSSLSPLEQSGSKPLVISILAGVPLAVLETGLKDYCIIRAMPNTPASVGAGITAIAPGKGITREQLALASTILSAIGKVVEVPESLMDAVTGLSGSGPAYVALMIEALSDGGVAVGLPRAIASQLALQTVLGTAQLLETEKLHPAELKDRVTSPGGTTIAGVAQLEKGGFRSALIEAVKAAHARSQSLGKSW